jgi:hypothetical protein
VRAPYLLIALFLFSPLSRAEEIQLKDGSKITGTLMAIEGSTFRVKTAYGEIQVPRAEIVAIQFPENSSKKEGSSVGASSPMDESLDGTLYSNRTAHFQVTVPADWTLSPELRLSKEVAAALKSADQAHFFMVTPEVFAGSLTTYRVLAETQYQSKFQEYKKLSESEAKLDGRTGLRLVWKAKTRDTNINVEFLVYILPYADRMVRLSFFTMEPLFDEAVPMFEKIAASYHSTSDKPVAVLTVPRPLRPERSIAGPSVQ